MSNWEDKYNKYKDGGIESEIQKIVARGINDEYDNKEYQKLLRIQKKMPEAIHIVELRDKLRKEKNQLEAELRTRRDLMQASKKIEKLGKEIDKLQEQSEKVAKQLKDPKITDEKRAELQAEQAKIGPEIAKKQDGIQANENILNNALGAKREFKDLSEEEIGKEIEDRKNKIKICNLAGNMLVNGMDWDKIEAKIDGLENKIFTSKDGKLKEKKENKKAEKKENKKAEELEEEFVAEELEEEFVAEEPEEEFVAEELEEEFVAEEPEEEFVAEFEEVFEDKENKPELTFADKHPRLAKVGNFFKNIKDKFVNGLKKVFKKNEVKEELEELEELEGEELEGEELKEVKQGEKSFRELLRQVAEKGIDGVEAEEKLAREQAAKERLAKMKAESRAKEAEKFGEDYAKKSDDLRGIEDEGR